MKRFATTIAVLLLFATARAQKVDANDAQYAATNYLTAARLLSPDNLLSLCHTYSDNNNEPVIYIFNIADSGFIAFGADLSFDPLIGYSFSGAFDSNNVPCGLKAWLESYVQDVDSVKKCTTKRNNIVEYHQDCRKKWKELLSDNTHNMASKAWETVGPLLETEWDQGGGYNNYCPTYSAGPNGHSHTGCVATAMAQIIRYHRYPTTGFSRSSYNHYYHGYQYAAYDSVTFDFNKMPRSVYYGSPSLVQHNVSLLCYYCGVSVKMNYLNPSHTTGSGAHSQDVPDGFKYFGYANAYYLAKPGNSNNQSWDSLLRNELDNARPVYYSGANSEGGHAFVCDGYTTNNNSTLYHFNFGWSGSGDGFYTLSSVNGFSSGQGAVFNIIPSNFTALGDTIYIASDGEGGGSSWNDANPNLHDAIRLAKLCNKKNIWVKNGTYLGNTSSPYAFEMEKGVNIYGGFNGTETSIDQRSAGCKSVMSGDGVRTAFYSPANTSNAAIYDMTFANGYAPNGAGANISSGVRMERCTIENNTATEGAALSVKNNTVYNCIIHNNYGGGVKLSANGSLRNSLIAHNDGFGAQVESSGIDGCDIVCNNGIGVIIDTTTDKRIRNSVIWNNNIQLSENDTRNLFFCAVEGLEEIDSNSNFGLSHENKPADGNGPYFYNPNTTVGPAESLGDWHICSRSSLIDAGDTVRSGTYIRDLDDLGRFRNGRVDIGCYEWNPSISIPVVSSNTVIFYPNPATSHLTIDGIQGQIDIFDIMGRHLLSASGEDGHTTIDVSKLPKGLYLLRSANQTYKFIKQ